ncbi:aspartate/glutamate racemase family protein [Qipengyuania atrilutea]|uniref:Amino acid racemase n=1 Tax=Qipengyuania atrilutea TaxID=2744473 RepID=A0A850H159_9SPHN|nr:amino acid racemase [Actirhodobacter atriluteus]NVD45671.1 amino acid racemase [Actirhodobacter atriluteus]
MRKLGLIGGMSWVSTLAYYERINRLVQRQSEPLASAPLVIESLDFRTLHGLREADDWERAAQVLSASARQLESAGATAIVIGANSMHKVYDQVADSVGVPIIHIAECVGRQMAAKGCKNAALIGTRNVMTETFYRQRLMQHGVELAPPDMDNVEEIDRIIYEELMVGKVTRDAERKLRTIFTRKQQEGVEAIVLACTEMEAIVDTDANVLPIYDSTDIHCQAAADWILETA